MTQPLYDEAQVEAMLVEANRRFGPRGFPVPVLLGVLPLQSARHAEFLHNEVPGITIPAATRTALRDAGDRGAEVGLEMTLGLLERVGSRVAGTYVMPSFGRYEQAAELVRRLRGSPGSDQMTRHRRALSMVGILGWCLAFAAGAAGAASAASPSAPPPGPPFPQPTAGRAVYDFAGRPLGRRDRPCRGDHRRHRGDEPPPGSSSTRRTAARTT